MQEYLNAKFARFENFSLVHDDFMEFDLHGLAGTTPLKVVGNLPYHLSSGIIYKLLEHNRAARRRRKFAVVLAGCLDDAARGGRTDGRAIRVADLWQALVFVQAEAVVDLHVIVPPEAFRPRPQVDGGVVRMEFVRLPEHYPTDYKLLKRVTRFAFSQRRKMLKSTLSQLAGVHPFWQQIN